MPQRHDNAGAVCNSGMGILFLCISFFAIYVISLRGVLIFFMHDAWFMMHDAWYTMHNTWWMFSRLCLEMSSFLHTYACAMPPTFLPSHEILFPVETAEGRSPSMVVFRKRSSSVKDRLWSKVVFHKRSCSVNGRLYFIQSNVILFLKSNLIQFNLIKYQVWHGSAQPFIFFLFELVNLNDLDYLSLRAGPRQWPQ